MTEILDNIVSVFKYLAIPSFILGIFGFIIMRGAKNGEPNDGSRKTFWIGAFLFAQVFLIFFTCFISLWTIEGVARNELKAFLKERNLKVKINGNLLDSEDSKKIISDLQTIKNYMGHHSSPTGNIELKIISDKETISLNLQQDSEIDTEYWVFWDKYNATKDNEIGRIRTTNIKK